MQQEKVIIYNPDLRGVHPIRAVLFDMDGLVLDTEKLYSRFWREATAFYGFPMTYEQSLGLRSLNSKAGEAKLKSYFGDGIDFQKVHDKRIELMDVFVEQEGVERKPGVEELLDYLKAHNIKTSIATSSPLERAKTYLVSVGLGNAFDEIVSGKMVAHGKPEPDVYLYAARKLGVKPEECMILEDSPTGIVSGYRAGCIPVMVPDQSRPDEDTRQMLYAEADGLENVIVLLEKCMG
uniref:HAD family hydrolase n=1 Tax=Agathobacter sp. TaxID=2021311 RepID=UPI0040575423